MFTFDHVLSHKLSKLISNGSSSHWNSTPLWPTGLSVYLGNTVLAWVRIPGFLSFFPPLFFQSNPKMTSIVHAPTPVSSALKKVNKYLFILSMVSLWYDLFLKGSHFDLKNETNYTKYAQMYMWHVHFVKHKNKQSPFSGRLSDLYTLCMHKKALYATKVTINVNYYSFTSFCFQANFAQICTHVLITLPENLVVICQVVLHL